MEYCKYHPEVSAQHFCPNCQSNCCDTCVDEGQHGESAFCFVCDQATVKADGPVDVTPFWRRIDQSFRYPLKKTLMAFLTVVSFLSAASSLLPFPLMVGLNLLTTGVIIKYCFNCLSETAAGNLSAPDIGGAYEGGIVLIFRLFLMMVVSVFAVVLIYAKVSPILGSLLGFFLLVASPAAIITYAMTEDMIAALNPLKLASLIATIGLPYGLILAMLMIMIGSIDILSGLIGFEQSIPVLTLQAVISNFYFIVMFHLMGYMIYQYQYELGVDTSSMHNPLEIRPEQQRLLARARVLLKEGYWGSAEKTINDAMKRFQSDEELNEMNFRFKLATFSLSQQAFEQQQLEEKAASSSPAASRKSAPKMTPSQDLSAMADQYLLHLEQHQKRHNATTAFQLVTQQLPNYKPRAAKLRHQLAEDFRDNGNPKRAAQLLNGLHRDNPKYNQLVAAYELLQRCLADMPGMEKQVQACGKLIVKLRNQKASAII